MIKFVRDWQESLANSLGQRKTLLGLSPPWNRALLLLLACAGLAFLVMLGAAVLQQPGHSGSTQFNLLGIKRLRQDARWQRTAYLFPTPDDDEFLRPKREHFPAHFVNTTSLTDAQERTALTVPQFLIIGVQVRKQFQSASMSWLA